MKQNLQRISEDNQNLRVHLGHFQNIEHKLRQRFELPKNLGEPQYRELQSFKDLQFKESQLYRRAQGYLQEIEKLKVSIEEKQKEKFLVYDENSNTNINSTTATVEDILLKQKLNSCRVENKRLLVKIDVETEDNQRKEIQIEKFNTIKQQLEMSLVRLYSISKQKKDLIESTSGTLEGKRLAFAVQEEEGEMSELSSLLSLKKERNESLNNQIIEMISKLESVVTQKEELTNRVQRLRLEIQALTKDKENFKEFYDSNKERIISNEIASENLKHNISYEDKQLSNLQQSLIHDQSEMTRSLREAMDKISQKIDEKLRIKQEEIIEKEQREKELIFKIDELEKKMRLEMNLKLKHETISSTMRGLGRQRINLEKRLAEINAKNKQLDRRKECLEAPNPLNETAKEVNDKREKYQKFKRQVEDLKIEARQKEKNLSDVKEKHERLLECHLEEQTSLSIAQNTILRDLNSELESLTLDLSETERKIEDSKVTHKRRMDRLKDLDYRLEQARQHTIEDTENKKFQLIQLISSFNKS